MKVQIQELVIDCADPAGLAEFWAHILEGTWGSLDEGWAAVEAGPFLLGFQRVPEGKDTAKNRLHLDIRVPDATAAIERALNLGARLTGHSHLDATGNGYTVLQDPEKNEFCFVVDNDGTWESSTRSAARQHRPA